MIIAVFLGLISYTLQANPSVAQNIVGNIQSEFNVPAVLYPFQSSPLDLVYAPTISCLVTASLIGTTSAGGQVPLSVQVDPSVSPFHLFDIIGNGNTIFQSLTVRTQMNCDNSSPTFPPTLVSGTVSVYWAGQNKAGQNIVLLQAPNSAQDVTPQTVDSTGKLVVGNVAGKTVTLGTWTLTKSQIENALGVSQGDSFSSTQIIDVSYNVIMHQGIAVTPWTLATATPMISYKFLENVNPIACLITCTGLGVPFNVVIDQPSNSQVNVAGVQTVKGHIDVQQWTASQGYPELKLFYTDPSSPNPQNALFDQILSNTNPTTSSSGTTTFPFTYTFPQTPAGLGKYTFTVYMNGRIGAQSADVYVSNNALTCGTGTFPYTNPTTGASFCKTITTGNTTGGGISNNPPPSCPTGQFCFPNAVSIPNLQQIMSGIALALGPIFQWLPYLAIAFIALLIIAHYWRKQNSGKPVIDHPSAVISETVA